MLIKYFLEILNFALCRELGIPTALGPTGWNLKIFYSLLHFVLLKIIDPCPTQNLIPTKNKRSY